MLFSQIKCEINDNTINLKIFILMVNIKNTLLHFKVNIHSRIKNKTTTIKDGAQKFKENFSEVKSKPRSKRKFLLLGSISVFSIFGVTIFAQVLPAVAKDIQKNTPGPGSFCPTPP